jgi:hypothetical protein
MPGAIPGVVYARDGHVQEAAHAATAHTYTFGQSVTFQLDLPSQADPDHATLYLTLNDQQTFSFRRPVEAGRAAYEHDLSTSPLPPFSRIRYRWDYVSPDGTRSQTETTAFRYVDNRFAWTTVDAHNLHVHWVDGERAVMVQALDIARDALAKISYALSIPLPEEVDVYLYPSQSDLTSALQLAGYGAPEGALPGGDLWSPLWAEGAAYPELDVILAAVPPTGETLPALQRVVPHELTHKALYDALGAGGYAALPTWLIEGLASYFEVRPDPTYTLALSEARERSQTQEGAALIPLDTLCLPFPEDRQRARLAYAQSASLITYLRETYGWSRIRALLDAYADGVACSTGVERVMGMPLDQLDRAWRIWLEQENTPTTTSPVRAGLTVLLRDTGPWLMLLGVMVLPMLIVAVHRRP